MSGATPGAAASSAPPELPVIDFADPAFWDDPHTPLREARRRSPLARTGTGEIAVLRYADVEWLSSDRRIASNALAFVTRHIDAGPLVEWWRRMLTNQNGPEHARLRSLVSRAFTPRAIDAKRPRMRELTRELVTSRADVGEMDVLHDLAHELPMRLMCELLGVAGEDHEAFGRWTTSLGRVLSAVMTPELRREGEQAVVALNCCVTDLVADRRRTPRDDLLSAMLRAADEAEEAFDEDDIRTLVVNLLFGGHDTSRSLLAIAVALLLTHPDQLARLRADPTLAERAGEEILRYEPVIGVMARQPIEDVEVAGVTLRTGEMFNLSILSANRDPAVFEDPDRFDVARPGPRHFGFGWGPHHCLGAALARAELQEVIPTLLECCPELELRIDAPRWLPHAMIRRIESLPVRFRPA